MKLILKNSTLSFRSKKQLVGDFHVNQRLNNSGLTGGSDTYNAVLFNIDGYSKIQVKTVSMMGSASLIVLTFVNSDDTLSSETIMSDGKLLIQDITGSSSVGRAVITSRDINVPTGAKRIGINYNFANTEGNPDGWTPQVFAIESAE